MSKTVVEPLPDWSHECVPAIRRYVRNNSCPVCESRAGMPCKNLNSTLPPPEEMFPHRKRKRAQKRQPFYFSFVHSARKTHVSGK